MAVRFNGTHLLKNPQALVSALSAAVAVLGTAGIVGTRLAGAVQALLMAVLGVFTALGHTVATARVSAGRQGRPAVPPPGSGA